MSINGASKEFPSNGMLQAQISLIIFSISCLLISLFLLNNQSITTPSLRSYVGLGFFSVSFLCFFTLIGLSFAYYWLKSYTWVRKNWEKYKWYYWITVLIIALVILIWIGYIKMSSETFWGVVISIFGVAILSAIGWIINFLIKRRKTIK